MTRLLAISKTSFGSADARSFLRNRQGSVGIMFALLFIPAFGLLACALDYSRSVSAKSAMLTAADNANFAGIGSSTRGYAAAAQQNGDGHVAQAEADAATLFDQQIALVKGASNIARTVSIIKTGGMLTSTITYTADVKTSFATLIGKPTIKVGGTTSATNGVPVYMDFYLLLDDSPSMGIAATQADINTMVANTPDQCAFACHDLNDPNSYYNLAKRLGVTTRIDVLRQATQSLFQTAQNTRRNPQQFGMATYTFDVALNKIGDLTEDMSVATAAAANIDLMGVYGQGWNNDQDTNFYPAMQGMNTKIPTPGTGVSTNSRQQVLFLVTDGVADYNRGGTRTIESIDVSLCTTLKNRGVKIAVLYTPYLRLTTNWFYMNYVDTFQPTIGPTLSSCATPGYYWQVSPNQGISDAMNALFMKVVGEAHITN